ncbi:hypothetical protein PVAG01_08727 [Phlyctema vagabunda]|uniref:Mid2 domain-containing protein n=1 Tax=Phlyctema vagabunda TaxID=108571 RepID=A0ABR4PA85_9HELO
MRYVKVCTLLVATVASFPSPSSRRVIGAQRLSDAQISYDDQQCGLYDTNDLHAPRSDTDFAPSRIRSICLSRSAESLTSKSISSTSSLPESPVGGSALRSRDLSEGKILEVATVLATIAGLLIIGGTVWFCCRKSPARRLSLSAMFSPGKKQVGSTSTGVFELETNIGASSKARRGGNAWIDDRAAAGYDRAYRGN